MADTAQNLMLRAPISGVLLPLAAVPDPVFASGTLGDGVAIDPLCGTLVAPCDGTVVQLAPTGHALTLEAPCGAQVLLHIGIDTVVLRGEGFAPCVAAGQRVRQGDVLVRFDVDRVARRALSLVTVMALANGALADGGAFVVAGKPAANRVEAGRSVLLVVRAARDAELAAAAADEQHGQRRTITLTCPGGLHARPAARARAAINGLDASVVLHYGGRQASLASLVSLLGLGAAEGAEVELVAHGADAGAALAAVANALQRAGAGEDVAAHAAAPVAAAAALAHGAIAGVAAAPGIAMGKLHWWRDTIAEPPEAGQGSALERDLLHAALTAADAQLAHDSEAATARGAAAQAGIFAMHRALLEDPALLAAAQAHIDAGKSAGFAWRAATRAEAAALARMADPLLAERAGDLIDLDKRVRRLLDAAPAQAVAVLQPPADGTPPVLAAEEFTPTDLASLDPSRAAALVMVRGGPTSHAAIIARQLGMPCLVALGEALARVADGTTVIVDGDHACLHAAPDAHAVAAANVAMAERAQRRDAELRLARAAASTRDGVRIEVAANVGSVADAATALAHGADAIGLVRTELLCLHETTAPTPAGHRETCQAIADAMAGRSVIVRTLDIGADKDAAWLRLPPEANPALGLRGVRLAQLRPQLLDDQLRGLLAVRAAVPLRILLPMITEVDELLHWRERIHALARETGAAAPPEVGVMIEVPSAALLADQLAEHADFFSIGTNDLAQYTLAMDRCRPELAARMDGLHPAVLRMVAATTEGAARHGRWVGVCGALAGDALAVPVLIGLGVTELSVDAALVPAIKARVRALSLADCRERAGALLRLPSAGTVRAACREYWPA